MAARPADPPKGVPSERLDRLYRGPLEEFTASRNELAKELRSDGEDEAATWVKELRKPTRAAWLVNQLSERKARQVADLLGLGEGLRALQEEMLAGGGDPAKLRKLAADEARAVERLREAAETIGSEHGATSQVLDRVGETLQAASSDPGLAQAIELGRVEREHRASSLGLLGSAPPAPRAKPAKKDDGATREKAERREAEKRRRAAAKELAAAEKHEARVRGRADLAREELERRERELAEAEGRLADARKAVEEAG